MKYITRHMEKAITAVSEQYPVVMVCGQRQTGKSTMLWHLAEPDRRYVSLDDARARNLAKNDPALFFETFGHKLIIDEFQRVPQLLLELKRIVDETAYSGNNANGMFWLSGSQKFAMMKNVSESLAGRVAVFNLLPLSAREIMGKDGGPFVPDAEVLKNSGCTPMTVLECFERIFQGGLPRLIAEPGMDRELYYSSYVSTYIERDISALEQVGKLDDFRTFMIYMAANTAQQLKYDAVARVVGVSAPTIKAWVSILERAGIIYILRPFASNTTKRLVKTPKCYFIDTGLAAYLTSWPSAETLMNGNAAGAFFETYVVSEILKGYYNLGKEPLLYYYRDAEQKEIDLLLQQGSRLYPIEIKKNKTPSDPTRIFGVLAKLDLEIMPGVVLCMTDKLFPFNRNAWMVPVGMV